jgi:electron transport complex protein RnfD
MLDVVIAMIPASIAAVVLFGLQALWIFLTCVASAVLSEFLFNLVTKRKQTIGDCSAIVTGLLLALNLSTNVPLWQCVVGSVFAIIIVKSLFGGLGHNIVNPAIAARVFMLLTFAAVAGGAQVSDFVLGDKAAELTASATPLAFLNEGVGAMEQAPSLFQLFLGTHGGAIGETCALALLIGFVYLVVRKVIKWYVPVSFIATVFVCYLVFTGDVTYSLAQVLAGGLFLGAIFMATDYVTTPTTGLGRVVFCVGCGLLTFAIRQFGSYPEGVSIAILTMNLLTPFISDWTKKKTLGGVK